MTRARRYRGGRRHQRFAAARRADHCRLTCRATAWSTRRRLRARAAAMATLITTAKLNDIDPQAWLADVLARINDLPQTRLAELLPWNWKPAIAAAA